MSIYAYGPNVYESYLLIYLQLEGKRYLYDPPMLLEKMEKNVHDTDPY